MIRVHTIPHIIYIYIASCTYLIARFSYSDSAISLSLIHCYDFVESANYLPFNGDWSLSKTIKHAEWLLALSAKRQLLPLKQYN